MLFYTLLSSERVKQILSSIEVVNENKIRFETENTFYTSLKNLLYNDILVRYAE